MLSMKSILKNTINGKDYIFVCDPDSPIADAIESNNQFGAFLLGKQEQAKAQNQAALPNCDIEAVPEHQETQE